jgi:hypothetical protein
LRKAGIEVPIPQRDLYLKSVSADILRQPGQETERSSMENSSQKPSAHDLLTLPSSGTRETETDPTHSTLRKSKDSRW